MMAQLAIVSQSAFSGGGGDGRRGAFSEDAGGVDGVFAGFAGQPVLSLLLVVWLAEAWWRELGRPTEFLLGAGEEARDLWWWWSWSWSWRHGGGGWCC